MLSTSRPAAQLVPPWVLSIYQTMLTNDPSLDQSDTEGAYSCTVENVRGESSGTVVVPGETWWLSGGRSSVIEH